jgi:hypothetical protein
MKELYQLDKAFEYENGYFATSNTARISKFVTHLELFQRSSSVRGEIMECGVFKGNSLFRWIKFRDLLENTFSRKIIAFDVFGAFPSTAYEPDQQKRQAFIDETNGGVGVSLEEINSILAHQGLHKNVELVKGDILKTLPEYLRQHPELKLSLVHIDVDIYEPTKLALELLFEHVSSGGIIVLDDYGAFPGTNKAIDEVLGGKYTVQRLPYSNAIGFVVK